MVASCTSSWLIFVTPLMSEVTASLRRHQAIASCAQLSPRSPAISAITCTRVRFSSPQYMPIRMLFWVSSAARVPSGAGWPGRYLPVRTPWAKGEKTTLPTPLCRQVGNTSASLSRYMRL